MFFSGKYVKTYKSFFMRKQCLPVYEIIREVSSQLRPESPVILPKKRFVNNNDTGSARKGHLQTINCRTVEKSESIGNVLTEGHNWLKTVNLIYQNLTKMTSKQAASHLKV